ncbi:hypothetical protein [Synechococcus sp. A15-44]|nr:hypothetical protein [Synechococcus sp. A15-44]QNI65424.1 hypothetical protein SynA1544_02503 [Synechococcus sp. A15-44]
MSRPSPPLCWLRHGSWSQPIAWIGSAVNLVIASIDGMLQITREVEVQHL